MNDAVVESKPAKAGRRQPAKAGNVKAGPGIVMMEFNDNDGHLIKVGTPEDLRNDAVSIFRAGIALYPKIQKAESDLKEMRKGDDSTGVKLFKLYETCQRRVNNDLAEARAVFQGVTRYAEDTWKGEQEKAGVAKPSVNKSLPTWVRAKSLIVRSLTPTKDGKAAIDPLSMTADEDSKGQAAPKVRKFPTLTALQTEVTKRGARAPADNPAGKVLQGLALTTPKLSAILGILAAQLSILTVESMDSEAVPLIFSCVEEISDLSEAGQRHLKNELERQRKVNKANVDFFAKSRRLSPAVRKAEGDAAASGGEGAESDDGKAVAMRGGSR